MSSAMSQVSSADLAPQSYVLLGLATCYLRQEGETLATEVVEPIPSAYLETLLQGTPTAYHDIWGTTLESALALDPTTLSGLEGAPVQRCADFEERVMATARTYQNRPQATATIPVGTHRQDLNYSTTPKRILNPKQKVLRSDNVKQHKYTHEVL
jgi:hypothetical protein